MSKRKDPLANLNPRKRKYVENRLKGMRKSDAARQAGFSEPMARKANSRVETPEVREAFRLAVQQAIPQDKIIQRLQQGTDAVTEKGRTDYRERREYIKLATQYGGYHVEKAELDVSVPDDGSVERLTRLLAIAASRTNKKPDSE